MKATISAAIRKTAKACLNDGVRPALKHVKLTDKEAIAVDGWILVIRKLDKPSGLAEGESICIPAAILKNPLLNLKKGSKDTLTIEEKETSWGFKENLTITRGNVSITQPAFNDKFPDTDKLLDEYTKEPEIARVGFTIALLKKLCESVEDDNNITFRIAASGKGVLFRTNNSKGAIMPASTYHAPVTGYSNAGGSVPAWEKGFDEV